MAGHLGYVSDSEWERLHRAVVRWLTQHNVAGSIHPDYSLYRALDDEREKAQERVRRRTILAQATDGVCCPRCGCWYAAGFATPGDVCGDLSYANGAPGAVPCPGILLAAGDDDDSPP